MCKRLTKTLTAAIVLTSMAIYLTLTPSAKGASTKTIEAKLNGLHIIFDAESGSIIELKYPGPGKMLDTAPKYAGLVDLAYPRDDFEPLRLASRYSKGARIDKSADRVTVTWDKLGPSRPFDIEGKVTVKVTIKALPDGQSILLQCEIDNQSSMPVRQVLFPDLIGLAPFAGEHQTMLRSGGFVIRPFQRLVPNFRGGFYPSIGSEVLEYSGGAGFNKVITRWLDFGSLTGGISIFPRVWVHAPNTKVRLHRTETHKTLRISWMHDIRIDPDKQWTSFEYVLTPHQHGWAKGIGPYRQWINEHVHRIAPMAEHVRKGLGYRTLWMCRRYPADGDNDVVFKFSDLPRLAKESKEHGLDEMVLWFWHPHFILPTPPPYEHLGTPQDLADAVKECKRIGVNVSLFISWRSLAEPSASRYGFKIRESWDYHPEMIPRVRPNYVRGRATSFADLANEQYRNDVLDSARNLIDNFTPSICWDQVSDLTPTGELYKVFEKIRKLSLQADPQSTFSGESVAKIEKDADYLDYTWNWRDYEDIRAYTSAFPAPRLNAIINRDVKDLWLSFIDNTYLNVMPSRPDDANATATIEEYPDISRALKQCAKLRVQFLPYFVEGTLIGDGCLAEPTDGLHVNAYALPDRLLMLAINLTDEQPFNLKCDLQPWLASQSDKYQVISYAIDGTINAPKEHTVGQWESTIGSLKNMELAIFEFIAQ